MQKYIKVLIPILETIVYILITGLVKNKWYIALISAPTVLIVVGIILFARVKMELQPRGDVYNYYILSVFMSHIVCLLIL